MSSPLSALQRSKQKPGFLKNELQEAQEAQKKLQKQLQKQLQEAQKDIKVAMEHTRCLEAELEAAR